MAAEGEKTNFSGKYKQVKSENFEEFLEANGAPWIARKFAANSSPDVEIIQEGDNFTLKVVSLVFSKESKFTIGTEFEEKQQNGTMMKVLPVWDDNKLVLNYSPKEEGTAVKDQKSTRSLEGNTLTVKMEVGDIVCTKTYEKVQ